MDCHLGTTLTNLAMFGTWLPSMLIGYWVFHLLDRRNSRTRSPFENLNAYRMGGAGAIVAGMAVGMTVWGWLMVSARTALC